MARLLRKAGLKATQINFFALIGCIFAAIALAHRQYLLGGVVFGIYSSFDAFDGSVAQLQGTALTFSLGAWLDAYFDSAEEGIVLLALVLSSPALLSQLAAIAMFLTFSVTQSKAIAESCGIKVDWQDVRVFGRGLRVIVITAGLVLAGVGALSSTYHDLVAMAAVLIAFNTITLAARIARIVRQARKQDRTRR